MPAGEVPWGGVGVLGMAGAEGSSLRAGGLAGWGRGGEAAAWVQELVLRGGCTSAWEDGGLDGCVKLGAWSAATARGWREVFLPRLGEATRRVAEAGAGTVHGGKGRGRGGERMEAGWRQQVSRA